MNSFCILTSSNACLSPLFFVDNPWQRRCLSVRYPLLDWKRYKSGVFLTFRTSSLRTWFCYYLVFTYDLRIEIIFSHNVITLLQDEAGTAAIKTIELDAVLGGRAVQHRELQGHESDKFLAYFKPCIIPLEGGVATGFKKAEEEAFETRLYVCRGKRVVRMKQV